MAKIGIIATPYRECFALDGERKKEEINKVKISRHGTVSGIIVGNRIMLTTIITDSSGSLASADLLLDTGSDITSVHPRIVRAFSKSDGIFVIGAHTRCDSQSITANLQIENTLTVENHEISVVAFEAFEDTGIDGVIGMDIIQAGELHVFRKNGLPYYEFTL